MEPSKASWERLRFKRNRHERETAADKEKVPFETEPLPVSWFQSDFEILFKTAIREFRRNCR